MYALDKLMDETRRLAAAYHLMTDQVMPVTAELARYDGTRLLQLSPLPAGLMKQVDAQGYWRNVWCNFLIKGRVLFHAHPSKERLGLLDHQADWQVLAVVLYNASYQPELIYLIDKTQLQQAPSKKPLSIQKCQKIGELVWQTTATLH